MTRVALDSNILIYAEMEPDSDKGKLSADLILRAARDGVIPVQVLGEYLRFIQRRIPAAFPQAIRQIAVYQHVFVTPPTTLDVLDLASVLARTHGMQLWDCRMCRLSAVRRESPADRGHAGWPNRCGTAPCQSVPSGKHWNDRRPAVGGMRRRSE